MEGQVEDGGDAGGLVVLRQVPRWATRMVLGVPPAPFPPVSDPCSHRNGQVFQEETGHRVRLVRRVQEPTCHFT